MRLDAEKGRHSQSPATKTSRQEGPKVLSEAKGQPRAKEAAENVILDAEQFQAQIQQPRGGCLNIIQTHVDANHFASGLDDDDQFFHVTCHIKSSLKSKIERGDFIELDRLLPKDPSGARGSYNQYDENKVELVSRGGNTYFKPIKETQINGLRKWEQAFRVYAAIYTQANPEKAGEIWQYMHVINVAALAYQWSNVASYDVTFRQLIGL